MGVERRLFELNLVYILWGDVLTPENIKCFCCWEFFYCFGFLYEGVDPSLVMLNPNHSICLQANLHFSKDIARLFLASFSKTAFSFCLWNSVWTFLSISVCHLSMRTCSGSLLTLNQLLLDLGWHIRKAVKSCLELLGPRAMLFSSKSMFGIYYMFLWINCLIFFESNASSTVWSFFTVMTIGLINCRSAYLFNLIMCFWSINF